MNEQTMRFFRIADLRVPALLALLALSACQPTQPARQLVLKISVKEDSPGDLGVLLLVLKFHLQILQ